MTCYGQHIYLLRNDRESQAATGSFSGRKRERLGQGGMKEGNFGNFCVGSRTRNNSLKRSPRRSSCREQLCRRYWQRAVKMLQSS